MPPLPGDEGQLLPGPPGCAEGGAVCRRDRRAGGRQPLPLLPWDRRHHRRVEGGLPAGLPAGGPRPEEGGGLREGRGGAVPPAEADAGRPLQGRESRRLRRHLRAPCHPAADQRRVEQRRARLLRRGAGDPPARPAGGPRPQHRAEILRGGDALRARGELHRGGQRPGGALAARRLFLAGAGDGLCDAAGSFPPGAAERPRVEGMGPWTAFSRC